jgi:hypothetical protein
MKLLEPYADFCFIFPMLFMSEYSVRKGLLLVAEMATSSLKTLGTRLIMP